MNDENLISLADRTPEEREEIARKGAKASAESKREKKILSAVYGEIIAEIYGVDCEDGTSIKDIVKSVLSRKDSSAVSMLKEMREATEGSKLALEHSVPDDMIEIFINNLKSQ